MDQHGIRRCDRWIHVFPCDSVPRRRNRRNMSAMLAEHWQCGDCVVTTSGFYGDCHRHHGRGQ